MGSFIRDPSQEICLGIMGVYRNNQIGVQFNCEKRKKKGLFFNLAGS